MKNQRRVQYPKKKEFCCDKICEKNTNPTSLKKSTFCSCANEKEVEKSKIYQKKVQNSKEAKKMKFLKNYLLRVKKTKKSISLSKRLFLNRKKIISKMEKIQKKKENFSNEIKNQNKNLKISEKKEITFLSKRRKMNFYYFFKEDSKVIFQSNLENKFHETNYDADKDSDVEIVKNSLWCMYIRLSKGIGSFF